MFTQWNEKQLKSLSQYSFTFDLKFFKDIRK